MRLIKASILAAAAVLLTAGLAFAVVCPTCKRKLKDGTQYCPHDGTKLPAATVKKPEPKPEPKKPEPKPVDPAVAKAAKAREMLVSAEKAWKADPKNYAAAIARYGEVKKAAAGTRYEKSAEKMIAKLTALKAAAEKRKKIADARALYETAYADYRKKPEDYAAAITAFGEVKKTGAGTGYDRKAAAMIAKLEKYKLRAAKKPEPKKPEPKKPAVVAIRKFVYLKVGDVAAPGAAFAKAQTLEKAAGKTPRGRAEAALAYYYAAVTMKNADGSRGKDAGAAALRLGELLEKFATEADDLASASTYYLVASHLDLDSGGWKKAEKLYLKAGRGAEFAKKLGGLAAKARAADRAKLAATLQARAEELARKSSK